MYIRHVERLSQEQLFEELREVRCMGNNTHVRPYQDAHFEIRMVKPGDFQPSALYVLRLELSFLSLLMDQLAGHVGGIENIDTLLEYEDEYGQVTRMIPPVVELTDFGHWMILDGEHRSFIARHRDIEIPMLFISQITAPYPCMPLPEGWRSVDIKEVVPILKRYRREGLNDTPGTELDLHRDLRPFGSRGTRKPLSPI